MGREGVLPSWLGRTHPVHRTPTNAILVIAVLATVAAFLVGFFWSFGGSYSTNYFFFASPGTIAVCLVYVVLCIGGSVYFRRVSARYNPVIHGLIPVIGIVVFGLAVYGSIYSGTVPPLPYTIVPYVNLGWRLLGIAFVTYLSKTAPEKVGQIGSILGEEGGETAASWTSQPPPPTSGRHSHHPGPGDQPPVIDSHAHPVTSDRQPLDLSGVALEMAEDAGARDRRVKGLPGASARS